MTTLPGLLSDDPRIHARRAAVLALLKLPLERTEIAEIIGDVAHNVGNDIARFKREGRIAEDERVEATFGNRLTLYLEARAGTVDVIEEHCTGIARVLRKSLDIEGIAKTAEAILIGIRLERRPRLSRLFWRTQRIVNAIFQRENHETVSAFEFDAALEEWGAIEDRQVPKNGTDLAELIVAHKTHKATKVPEKGFVEIPYEWYPETLRVPVVIVDATRVAVERAITEACSERQRFILDLCFPQDDGDGISLSEIGRKMGLSPERTRQLQQEALLRIRNRLEASGWDIADVDIHEVRVTGLRRRLKELEALCNRLSAENEQWRRKESETGAKDAAARIPELSMHVNTLGISVRTANCLQQARIEFIWQLVEKTHDELRGSGNLGVKSLRELEAVLSEKGLRLGMKAEISALREAGVLPS